MKTTTYLVLSRGRAHKFYQVTVDGRDVVCRWGRIERPAGELQVLAPNQAEAARVARKKVDAKLRRGYRLAKPSELRHRAPVPADEDPRQLALWRAS